MDYSSSSTHYKGLIPFMYSRENQDHHHQHQEKEWLPSSTTHIDVKLDPSTTNDNDNNDDDKDTQEEGGGNNNNSTDDGSSIEREHMFDKVVTPSDVGKLNRLVIPKQHAEKYFPLDSSTNTSTEQKAGLLLNFEDLSGKSWRFRYSYWNSSQSYVMTKGWSRFVKEKQLTAGDIVSFQRGVVKGFEHKFFIDWRHRPPDRHHHPHHHHHHHHLGTAFAVHRTIPGTATAWNNSSSTSTITPTTFFLRSHPYPTQTMPTSIWDHSRTSSTQLSQVNMMSTVPYASYSSYGSNININTSTNSTLSTRTNSVVNTHLSRGSLIFVRSSPLTVPLSIDPHSPPAHHLNLSLYCNGRQQSLPDQDDGDDERKVFGSVPVPVPLLHGKAAAKRSVRLFGVNVDCPPISHEDQN